MSAGHRMYLLMFKGHGLWGYFWYIMTIMVSLFAAARILSKYDVWRIQKINGDLLFFVMMGFMILRLMIYTVFESLKADTWNDSGNRMLLHIYPTCLFFLAEVLHSLYCRISEGLRAVNILPRKFLY